MYTHTFTHSDNIPILQETSWHVPSCPLSSHTWLWIRITGWPLKQIADAQPRVSESLTLQKGPGIGVCNGFPEDADVSGRVPGCGNHHHKGSVSLKSQCEWERERETLRCQAVLGKETADKVDSGISIHPHTCSLSYWLAKTKE